jgi:hypothetical protein
MSDKKTARVIDDVVITIGVTDTNDSTLADIIVQPANEDKIGQGTSQGVAVPVLEPEVESEKMSDSKPIDQPAPVARLIVLGLALVGFILILVYVLNYWGVIQLPIL